MATPETTAQDTKSVAPTSAASFKKASKSRNEVKTVELPSGNFVSLKRPSVASLLKSGHVPSDIASSLQNVKPGQQPTGDTLVKYLKLQDIITRFAVVSPEIVPDGVEPTDDQISLDDLEDTDKGFILQYVQEGVTDLTPFRTKQ